MVCSNMAQFSTRLTNYAGTCPPLKFSTVASRLSRSYIQPSLLFFRTSSASRSTLRFLNETRIIPPLSYTTCVHTLETIQKSTSLLEIHFADGEADAYAVELAGRVGGYVLGNDSDFVVLHTEGYLGYIPLDEMMWQSPLPVDDAPLQDKSGFRAVRNSKTKWKVISESGRGRSLVPPNAEGMTLIVTVYRPETLAEHFKIPVTLLPLLGALVGNDFTSQSESNRRSIQSLFFEKHLNLVQRITLVANTIQNILSPAAQKRKKQKHQVGSVMDLIDSAVNSLLSRSITFLGSGEMDNIADRIVEGTLQYAIPRREGDPSRQGELWPTEVCALHEPEACPLLPMISRALVEAEKSTPDGQDNDELTRKHALRGMFLDAYRKGHLAPDILDTLNSGTFWPRHFLEDPDLETVSRSFSRPIRQWGYAIIHDAVGLPCMEDESDESDDGRNGPVASDEDELVDVIESDDGRSNTSEDDPLAPLKGELYRLRGSATVEVPSSISSAAAPRFRLPIITEYIRRGARVAQEEVIVKPLHELVHSHLSPNILLENDVLLLHSQGERLTLFLQILHSDTPIVRTLPPEQMTVALCLRWVVLTIHQRAQESDSMDRHKERWTKHEAQCFLASFGWTTAVDTRTDVEPPSIVDRNVQLAAQTLSTMESIEQLSQILFLSDILPSSAHNFSGKAFHAYLTGLLRLEKDTIPTALLKASIHGLEDVLAEEKKRKPKKIKKETDKRVTLSSRSNSNGGLFHLLADVEA
jgi:XPG domain containing